MHDRLSVNSLCFWGQSLDAITAAWQHLAPARISVEAPLLAKYGEDELRRAISSYKIETFTHALHLGPLSPDEATWQTHRAEFSNTISFARSVGARSIYLVTGGRPRHMRWEEAAEIFSAILAPVLPEARAAGMPILIETAPTLYAGIHLCHNLPDTIRLAELAGIGVCIDMFSVWAEAGLKESIARAMPLCHLVQVGDYVCGDAALPCRAVPGDGDIPIRQICEWLLDAGYAGGFDFELIGPRIEGEGPVAAVKRAGEYMTRMLDELGV